MNPAVDMAQLDFGNLLLKCAHRIGYLPGTVKQQSAAARVCRQTPPIAGPESQGYTLAT